MTVFARPRVLLSRCIEHDHCRWNGLMIASDVVKLLKPHVDFVTVCPEADIGLGIPREPVRIIETDSGLALYQPATDRHWTTEMIRFSTAAIDSFGELDGAILKSRSPTCGARDVKVYPSTSKGMPHKKGVGFFAQAVMEWLPDLALEDEGRLTNYRIREHFMTRIYVSAAFRKTRAAGTMGALVDFQSRNKLLFMAYNQSALHRMGSIVANHERRPVAEVFAAYETEFSRALSRPSRRPSAINVLMHAVGYFKTGLLSSEKTFFADCLEDYRAGRVPLSVPVGVIRSWIVRFDQAYLRTQTFFEPYPEDLVQITDSGKGRDLR